MFGYRDCVEVASYTIPNSSFLKEHHIFQAIMLALKIFVKYHESTTGFVTNIQRLLENYSTCTIRMYHLELWGTMLYSSLRHADSDRASVDR